MFSCHCPSINHSYYCGYNTERDNMAEVIKDDVVVSLSATEKAALLELLDAQESLDPRLADLNNSLQTV